MPELQTNLPALGMNGLNHFFPALHLAECVNTRGSDIALTLLADLRGLGNDEPSLGTLGVIGSH